MNLTKYVKVLYKENDNLNYNLILKTEVNRIKYSEFSIKWNKLVGSVIKILISPQRKLTLTFHNTHQPKLSRKALPSNQVTGPTPAETLLPVSQPQPFCSTNTVTNLMFYTHTMPLYTHHAWP